MDKSKVARFLAHPVVFIHVRKIVFTGKLTKTTIWLNEPFVPVFAEDFKALFRQHVADQAKPM